MNTTFQENREKRKKRKNKMKIIYIVGEKRGKIAN